MMYKEAQRLCRQDSAEGQPIENFFSFFSFSPLNCHLKLLLNKKFTEIMHNNRVIFTLLPPIDILGNTFILLRYISAFRFRTHILKV